MLKFMKVVFKPKLSVSVYIKAVGGEVPATSSLAPKIGPLGLVGIKIITCPAKMLK